MAMLMMPFSADKSKVDRPVYHKEAKGNRNKTNV